MHHCSRSGAHAGQSRLTSITARCVRSTTTFHTSASYNSLLRRADRSCVEPRYSSFISCSYRFIGDRPATFAEVAEALKVLDVSINVGDKELKKKYHQLVKQHHPDTGGDEKQMSKISVAYETLTKMTSREKEQFELQKKSYSPTSGHSSKSGFQSARGGTGAYRRPYEEPGQYDNTNFNRQAEYARAYAQSRQGFYTYRNGGPGSTAQGANPFNQNPFGQGHPFNMGSHFRQFGRMSTSSLLLRGFLLYMLLSLTAAAGYRSYRDWANDDGWKMAESLSRHEQLAELHRIRQEMKDRMSGVERAREEAYQREAVGTFSAPFRRSAAISDDFEKVKELRALEYAQKRQMDMQMQSLEMKGFPKFDSSKGSLIKVAGDPAGVVHFVPRVGEAPTAPQGPNNNPENGKNVALTKAMQDQQRQQAEFLAQKQAASKSSPGGGQAAPMDFKFQDVFRPPARASTV